MTDSDAATTWARVAPFVRGGLSGVISWLAIHPADVVKVRMQLAGEGSAVSPYRGFMHAMASISRNEGVGALYSGLSAALTRQVTYTTLRLGLYSSLRDAWSDGHGGHVSTTAKFSVGMAAGAIASAVSTPVEVSMVRMYNDGALSKGGKKGLGASRGYRNIVDALWRIGREEGLSGLWRGATPTIVRSMVVNCVQLGTYDAAKERILTLRQGKDGVSVHLAASTISGFCYSIVTLPIDSAKTRVQNQARQSDGTLPYRNLGHAIVKVARQEGVVALWRGFLPYFARCAGTLTSA